MQIVQLVVLVALWQTSAPQPRTYILTNHPRLLCRVARVGPSRVTISLTIKVSGGLPTALILLSIRCP